MTQTKSLAPNKSAALCASLSDASGACDFAACTIETFEDSGDRDDVEEALAALASAESAIIAGRLRLLAIKRGES